MSRAHGTTGTAVQVATAATVGLPLLALVGMAIADRRLVELGRGDLRDPAVLVYLVALMSASGVGAVLVWHRPANPAGWCFAALGSSMAVSGALDGYAVVGAVAAPGSLPLADVAAVLGDASFIPWLVLVTLALHLTPTGRPLSPRWGRAAVVAVAAAAVWWLAKCLSATTLDRPFTDVRNPMAMEKWSDAVELIRGAAGLVTGLGLLLAGLSLLLRFRRASGTERQQLHWLALAVIPLPLFVGLSFFGAGTGRPLLVVLATSGYVALIPIAAGLAIGRYHLYDVDHLLSRATTYALLTGGVLAAYVSGVVIVERTLRGLTTADRATVSAVVAALAVAAAAPVRQRVQDVVDRRFSRRRFGALSTVHAHTRDPEPGATVDSVLRDALNDPSLEVAYWIGPQALWVTSDGTAPSAGGRATIDTSRHNQPVARITFDTGACNRELVAAVAAEALPLLENAGLRAALALELVEVSASRARIADAQLHERQRIERDLHDGAQQRLLAMAMQLRAALVNGDPARLREAARIGVAEAQETVLELRELANGLHPTALAHGGLSAAIEDLATRVPAVLELHVEEQRYPKAIEVTAWFVVCEAVANAMKHAAKSGVSVAVEEVGGSVIVRVRDDGPGIADPDGRGLRGLADRAAAVGGRLHVHSTKHGTEVRAELPCVS